MSWTELPPERWSELEAGQPVMVLEPGASEEGGWLRASVWTAGEWLKLAYPVLATEPGASVLYAVVSVPGPGGRILVEER